MGRFNRLFSLRLEDENIGTENMEKAGMSLEPSDDSLARVDIVSLTVRRTGGNVEVDEPSARYRTGVGDFPDLI